jgi:hypothetical protein
MTRRRIVAPIVAGALALAGCARTPPPPPPTAAIAVERAPGTLYAGALVTATAVVESIDQTSRMVTLRRANGERVRFRVGDDVQNLGQVRRGDDVTVSFYESLALRLQKPGEARPGVQAAEGAGRAEAGQMPAAWAAGVTTVTAKVAGIGRDRGSVTLAVPEREPVTIKVEDPTLLEPVRVGDTVQATYREAIAVAVERPAPR